MILYFTVPPEIREFVNTTGTEGAAATLTCKAYGDPIPTIIFKKDDQVFTDVAQEVRSIVNLSALQINGKSYQYYMWYMLP